MRTVHLYIQHHVPSTCNQWDNPGYHTVPHHPLVDNENSHRTPQSDEYNIQPHCTLDNQSKYHCGNWSRLLHSDNHVYRHILFELVYSMTAGIWKCLCILCICNLVNGNRLYNTECGPNCPDHTRDFSIAKHFECPGTQGISCMLLQSKCTPSYL